MRARCLMGFLGLKSVIRKRQHNYIKSAPEITAENVMSRNFKANVPFKKRAADAAKLKYYVGAEVKKLQFSAILDLYD